MHGMPEIGQGQGHLTSACLLDGMLCVILGDFHMYYVLEVFDSCRVRHDGFEFRSCCK